MIRYFLLGASKDHVSKGVEGGFAQAGHGRMDLLGRLAKCDWIVYYAAKDKYEGGKAYQKFAAIGQITDDAPYQLYTKDDFRPYRRNTDYKPCQEADIRPLIEQLSFIANKKK